MDPPGIDILSRGGSHLAEIEREKGIVGLGCDKGRCGAARERLGSALPSLGTEYRDYFEGHPGCGMRR